MHLQSHEISCVILPMTAHLLLVPNVSVAEIIEFHFFQKVGATQSALIGKVKWRGIEVPVLDFELSIDASAKRQAPQRIAIMNQVTDRTEGRFFGIAAMGLPRLVKVSKSALKADPDASTLAEHLCVKLEDEQVVIPNLEQLELAAFA